MLHKENFFLLLSVFWVLNELPPRWIVSFKVHSRVYWTCSKTLDRQTDSVIFLFWVGFFFFIWSEGLVALTIRLCHLPPPPLSSPVVVTKWPISHISPICLTQHPLHQPFTQGGKSSRLFFSATPASTGLVSDHPQLPHYHPSVPGREKVCPL